MMVKADGVKRVERKPTPLPDRKEEPEAPVVVGATGRGLPVSTGPVPVEPPPPDNDDTPRRAPGGPSPFSGYAPTADELAQSAAAGAESSNQVAAIVLGMGFVLSVASILVLIIIGAGLFAWTQVVDNDGVADGDEGKGHVIDTAVADEIIKQKPGYKPKPGGAAPDPDDPDAPPPEPSAPTVGPVTITVPEHVFFHSLEINCPDAGIRRRASFRGRRASTTGVPISEDCVVTFQGSEPAKTTIRGGQNKDCVSFNPTECRVK